MTKPAAKELPPSGPTEQRAVRFLLKTRAKPVQTYFDNGDPHGKHQFLSTAWATAGLAQLLLENREDKAPAEPRTESKKADFKIFDGQPTRLYFTGNPHHPTFG